MTNKKLWLKLGIFALSLGGIGLSFTSAALLKVQISGEGALSELVKKFITPIHFADNGNDFGGFLYISNLGQIINDDDQDSQDLYYVGTGGDEPVYECKMKVKGYYYNSERGERLWPLDEESTLVEGVDMTGGVYSRCRVTGYEEYSCKCTGGEYDKEANECVCKNGIDPVTKECNPVDCGDDVECLEMQEKGPDVCREEINEKYPYVDGFFGQVEHSFSGQVFGLVIGTTYGHDNLDDYKGKWYSIEKQGGAVNLQSSFIMFNKISPVGFIYDYNGGLGFAGCQIVGKSSMPVQETLEMLVGSGNEGKLDGLFEPYYKEDGQRSIQPASESPISGALNCDKIGSMGGSLIGVLIEGLVGLGGNSDFSSVGGQNKKMQYFSSSDINSATLLNYARQKSEILCRGEGKWLYSTEALDIKVGSDRVVCLNGKNIEGGIGTGVTLWAKNNGKTLVVKNADVTIDPFTDSNDTTYYDIFVNSGNLIINETPETEKFIFDRQGFIVEGKNSTDFRNEVGASINSENPQAYNGDLAAEASLLRGNFVIDGEVKGPIDVDNSVDSVLKNKYFIYGKFTTKDSFDDLDKKFKWRCDGETSRSNDDSYCPPSFEGWYNPYWDASLVIIDQDYDSPLYW